MYCNGIDSLFQALCQCGRLKMRPGDERGSWSRFSPTRFFDRPHWPRAWNRLWNRSFAKSAIAMEVSIAYIRYINIRTWLRDFRVKIANFKRDLDTKKTRLNIEVCPEGLGAILEYWYIGRDLLPNGMALRGNERPRLSPGGRSLKNLSKTPKGE